MDTGRESGATALMRFVCATIRAGALLLILGLATGLVNGQSGSYARSFAKPRPEVEQALKELQVYSGQKLPILDGFVVAGEKPLDRYERGFCQFTAELLPGDGNSTVVRLSAKITAWYADRDVAKSGYEVLPSNGRLELDFLDRLEEKLTGKKATSAVQTPRPKLDLSGVPGAVAKSSSSLPSSSSAPSHADEVDALRKQREVSERRVQNLTTELKSLKEIQQNQAHPQNLVTVLKSGTAVYAKGTETSRVLFQASANDEFEFLDADGEFVHVGISGDSRGYVLRSSVEIPERIAAKLRSAEVSPEEKFSAFRIEREETSAFPGDWAGLRGKTVKIYTVLPVSQNAKDSAPAARLNYSLALFEKGAKEAASTNPAPEGVVVIFDAADGGIAGATLAEIQKFFSGGMTKEAFWSQSYLDPIEVFRPVARP
jgi:hypothetical protein